MLAAALAKAETERDRLREAMSCDRCSHDSCDEHLKLRQDLLGITDWRKSLKARAALKEGK